MFKRRVRQIPDPPKPCYVENENGQKYYLKQPEGALPEDNEHDILVVVLGGGLRQKFESHARAHSAIHHTIEYRKARELPWSKESFRVVDF